MMTGHWLEEVLDGRERLKNKYLKFKVTKINALVNYCNIAVAFSFFGATMQINILFGLKTFVFFPIVFIVFQVVQAF